MTFTDFPAKGKVTSATDGNVVFAPQGTNYELKLDVDGKYDGPVNEKTAGLIRVSGRKVWTVPSGGNFIVPIKGTPRIVQGRIRYIDENFMVVQAGTSVIVELPSEGSAFDMVNGPLGVGTLVNVTVMPGASFELATGATVK